MTLREHTGRTVEFKLVDRNTNIDFCRGLAECRGSAA